MLVKQNVLLAKLLNFRLNSFNQPPGAPGVPVTEFPLRPGGASKVFSRISCNFYSLSVCMAAVTACRLTQFTVKQFQPAPGAAECR